MIEVVYAAAAAHVVAFPSGLYGWLSYINTPTKAGGSQGIKRSAAEAQAQAGQAQVEAHAINVDIKSRAKKSRPASNSIPAQYSEVDSDFIQSEYEYNPKEAKPKGSKQREQEVVMQMRGEREREHIKLLCDLAANRDLGIEVTDAAKHLVLEFLKKPVDEEIDLEALRQSIPA